MSRFKEISREEAEASRMIVRVDPAGETEDLSHHAFR